MLIAWCMGVTLLIFMPSRVAKRPIKIRNEKRIKRCLSCSRELSGRLSHGIVECLDVRRPHGAGIRTEVRVVEDRRANSQLPLGQHR